MTRFSANLGFLWTEIALPDAIRAAATAKFEAVECHWPYNTDPALVKAALDETGLPMLGLNTARGDGNGLSALAGREADARAAIDQAVEYAVAVGAHNIHVMAGFASGKAAHETFVSNLRYALARVTDHGISLLIEPLNHFDASGYFLQTAEQAAEIIAEINAPNLKLMFDCYHVQIMQGDISRRLQTMLPIIGHIQIAAVPSRTEPDEGELDYRHILKHIEAIGYKGFIGAEYHPRRSVDAGLGWRAVVA
ncbi:MAG: isomerase [Rhodobacteraceae bacterium]|nr:MAG: isomerase [Paracoccaceae bacterium]